MNNSFLLTRFVLATFLLSAASLDLRAATQDPKPPENAANAFKLAERDRTGQPGSAESANQKTEPEIASTANAPGKPTNNDSISRQFYESGTNLYAAGKFEEAIDAFQQSAKLKPDNPQTHYGLGMAYAKSKSYREASESFKRAVKLKPDWPEANFRVGMMAYVLGNKSQATEVYNKLRKLNSPLANTFYRVIREDGSAGIAENLPTETQPKPANVIPVAASVESEPTRTDPPADSDAKAASTTPATEPVKSVSVAPTPTPNPNQVSEQPLTSVYRVGVGDILDVRLLNAAIARSTLFTVIDGGLIDFPIAGGPIQVAGLTADEIQSRISSELKRRAVEVNAQVSVGVRQFSSHAVIVTGLVANPGTRFLRREAIPLYVLMAEVQPRLDAGRITILRAGAEAQTFDLSDSKALSTLIMQGDVLNVGPRPQEFYYIGGRVNYPGQKVFQSGISLLQALLAAGGPSQNEDKLDLSREGSDGRLITTRLSLKDIKSGKTQDPKLRSGDRIEIMR